MTNTDERSREIAIITVEVMRDAGLTDQSNSKARAAAIREVMNRSGCKLTAATAHVKRALQILEAERNGQTIETPKRGGYRRNAGVKKGSKRGPINVENRRPRGPNREKLALKALATNPPVVEPDKQHACLATIVFSKEQFPILINRETPSVLFCESIDATDKPPGYVFGIEEARRLALGDKITLYKSHKGEWRFEGRQPIWRGVAIYNSES